MPDDRPDPPKRKTKTQPVAPETPAQSATNGPFDTAPHQPQQAIAGVQAPSGYQIVRRLGEGGMGVVYEARDLRDGRPVAMKTIAEGRSPRMAEIIRFLAEAEVQASFTDDHVVRVFKVGEVAGRPYMLMEYLPGGTLGGKLAGGRLKAKQATALITRITRGVAAAHARGIFHRDLKPANILFDEAGQAKVADFGLAKRDTSALTKTGAVMGTPAYMAPEQASGQNALVGAATDVWALGVILYECVTGTRPFVADDLIVLMGKLATQEPPSILKRCPDVPRDLERICLKCLEKDPKDRYPTAAALLDDLEAHAAGKPIGVRKSTWLDRAAKWARKRPTAAAAWALTLLVVLLGSFAAVVAVLWRDADKQRAGAVEARGRAEQLQGVAEGERDKAASEKAAADQLRAEAVTARDALGRANYFRSLDLGWRAHLEGNGSRARQLLGDVKAAPKQHGWEWGYVSRRATPEAVAFERPPDATEQDRSAGLLYTQDGRFLVQIVGRPAERGEVQLARVWDATTAKFLHTFPPPGAGRAEQVVLAGDGSRVLVRPQPGKLDDPGPGGLFVYDTTSGKQLAHFPNVHENIRFADATADGNTILLHLGYPPPTVVPVPPVSMPAAPGEMPKPGEKSPEPQTNGEKGEDDRAISARQLIDPPPPIPAVVSGRAAVSDRLVVLTLRTADVQKWLKLEGNADGVAVVRDGAEVLASERYSLPPAKKDDPGETGSRLVAFDVKGGTREVLKIDLQLPAMGDPILAMTPDRTHAVLLLKSGNAGLYEVATRKVVREFPAAASVPGQPPRSAPGPTAPPSTSTPPNPPPPPSRLALGEFHADGKRLTLCSVGRMETVTVMGTNGVPQTLTTGRATLTTHDTKTGEVLRTRPVVEQAVSTTWMCFSPDGRWFVSSVEWQADRSRHVLRLVNTTDYTAREVPVDQPDKGYCFDWSPDGRRVAVCRGETVFAYDLDRPDLVTLPTSHGGSYPRGYTADGKALLLNRFGAPTKDEKDGDTGGVGLVAYDTRTGRPAWPADAVPTGSAYAYSRDGKVYVSEPAEDAITLRGVGDNVSRSIRLPAGTLPKGTRPLWAADGRHFFTMTGGLRRWDAETGKEVWARADLPKLFAADETMVIQEPRTGMVYEVVAKQVKTADGDATVYERVPVTVTFVVTTAKHPPRVSPDGSVVALLPDSATGANGDPVQLADVTNEVRLLDGATGADTGRIPFDSPPNMAVFSPDSTRLAVVVGTRVQVYDARTRKLVVSFQTPGQPIAAIAFSPDGTRIATTTGERFRPYPYELNGSSLPVPPYSVVTLWDAADGREVCGLPTPVGNAQRPIYFLEFHPDGSQLAVGSGDKVVLLTAR